MDEQKFNTIADLYLLDELSDAEKINFENYLFEDSEAFKKFEQMKKIHTEIIKSIPEPIEDFQIEQARDLLHTNLLKELNKEKKSSKLKEMLEKVFFSRYAFVYSSAAAMFAGIFIGYLFFSASIMNTPNLKPGEVNLDEVVNGDFDISNIRFPNPFSDNGEVEIQFDMVRPITYKATPGDPIMNRVLAAALVNAGNPAVRLQTVNTLSAKSTPQLIMDSKIKSALLQSIKTDDNPAVRKEALNLLAKLPYDEEIRDAVLYVLSNDSNSGNRVLAINILSDLKMQGVSVDEKIKSVLENRKQADDNGFVKNRAEKILMGE